MLESIVHSGIRGHELCRIQCPKLYLDSKVWLVTAAMHQCIYPQLDQSTFHIAETIIAEGQADIVLLARQMMRNPYWPMQAAQELGADAKAHVAEQIGFFVG